MNHTDYCEMVNKTWRGKGAVGRNAIVPRLVEQLANKKDKILDYGAGKIPYHARHLRKRGFKRVQAYDVGTNFTKDHVHVDTLLKIRGYDWVYASNVLNVQPAFHNINNVIVEISMLLNFKGKFICNYPHSPRYTATSTHQVERLLQSQFEYVFKVSKLSSPVWVCTQYKPTPTELFGGKS